MDSQVTNDTSQDRIISLEDLHGKYSRRVGWNSKDTYVRATFIRKLDGSHEYVVCAYLSRDGDQGKATECYSAIGTSLEGATRALWDSRA